MNYAPATSKASKLPRLLLKAMLWFFVAIFAAGAGMWWFMNQERGARWARKVIHDRFPDVRGISPQELNSWLQDPEPRRPPPLVLDVRTPEEQEVSTLRGARCVSPEDSVETVLEGVGHDRPLVVYCTGGYRGAAMAQRLTRAGHAEVANLEGGIFGWTNAGFPVEKDGIVVSKVHPYSSVFSRMLKRRDKEVAK